VDVQRENVTRLTRPAKLTFALRPELPRLSAPTLFIWGDKDAFGSPSLGLEMCKVMPHARTEVLGPGIWRGWINPRDVRN
jgi:pimeloyl-ACP methyl ester carboxylesterase